MLNEKIKNSVAINTFLIVAIYQNPELLFLYRTVIESNPRHYFFVYRIQNVSI